MSNHGKRYKSAFEKVDRTQALPPVDAVKMVKELATAKFDETIEVHLNLGVDPRHADQQIRGVVTMPSGTGREEIIVVFANPEGQTLAKEAGADEVGADELADRIQGGWTDFTMVLATPDMMRVVGKLGRVLGPRNMMPSPKTGTIVPAEDLPRVINEARLGRVDYRIDKTSNLHISIGKASFTEDQIMANLSVIMEAVAGAKPSSIKGTYLKKATITSTMGPGIIIDPNAALELRHAA